LIAPVWALWVFAAMFAFMAAVFTLVWWVRRQVRPDPMENLVCVDGVVVDRVERVVTSPRGKPAPRVDVTVEYRDHHGAVRRVTADEGSFFRFVGDTNPVFYDRAAPADARLEVHRGIEVLFAVLGLVFGGLTLLFASLAVAAA
jgi:hypothetical protein